MEKFSVPENYVIRFTNKAEGIDFTELELKYKGEENGIHKYSSFYMNVEGETKSILRITVEHSKLNEAEISFYGNKYQKVEEPIDKGIES
jgi:hypothetical protein